MFRDVIAGSHDRSGSMSWFSLRRPPAQAEEGDGFVLFEGEVKRAAEALVAASAVLGADIEAGNVFLPDEAGDDEAGGPGKPKGRERTRRSGGGRMPCPVQSPTLHSRRLHHG
jgi:hypothetical protein